MMYRMPILLFKFKTLPVKKKKKKRRHLFSYFENVLYMYAEFGSSEHLSLKKQNKKTSIRKKRQHYANTPIQIYWKFHHQNLKVFW